LDYNIFFGGGALIHKVKDAPEVNASCIADTNFTSAAGAVAIVHIRCKVQVLAG
jgi:hypothetical protein